ncbi:outer membrane protein transport protein [Jannaschia sp. Os4]|uniref:OmpP1/FadL family transporter n=1 Tax=Jannaschia sp. Os4 TaxID=2807617 RepID=UPI00193AB55F|nr:outer membrane protein transport protein [Jannaschia sp. Os4]MBM2576673.1 outer membrane protein transport protein [Jannaschia sp. Os4]
MNRIAITAVTATLLAGTSAHAGGLDRSGQSISPLFNAPGTASFGLSYVKPDLRGEDVDGDGSYDAGESYTTYTFSYADQITDRFSYAVIADQPFGADIFYDDDPASSNIGGTLADINSDALSLVGRYKINERFSVIGGLRAQNAGGEVALRGQSYANAITARAVADQTGLTAEQVGGVAQAIGAVQAAGGNPAVLTPEQQALIAQVGGFAAAGAIARSFLNGRTAFDDGNGYAVDIEDSWGLGYTLGFAYEIPDIALRLAVTWNSEVSHSGTATESVAGMTSRNTIDFETPESINVEFQTGVAEDTLLLASLRYTDWDDFDVIPPVFGVDLADIDDSYRWSLGVARRFTPEFVGIANLTYEKDNGSETVSPLGPTDGQIGLSLAGRYTSGNLNVTGGINYTKVGSAFAGVADSPVAEFNDSSAVGIGLQVQYKF